MKIRILDRILVALAGLLMMAAAAALAAQLFFQKDVVGWIGGLISDEKLRVFLIIGGALVCLLGLYCLLMLFRHRGKNGKFITQKTESGELSISLKAIESMVMKCLEQHKEISTQGVHLDNQKGSLLIRIRGTVAGGVSIPLTVDTLQQQIKQYVTACSGVEVKEIRVQIESSGKDAKDAPFAIAAPAAPALLKAAAEEECVPEAAAAEEKTAPEAAPPPQEPEKAVPEDSAAAAAAAAAALMEEVPPEEDDRPVHQRLFSTMEEPCVMPMPPTAKETEEDAKTTDVAQAEEDAEKKNEEKPADSAGEAVPEADGSMDTRADEKETNIKDAWTEGSDD